MLNLGELVAKLRVDPRQFDRGLDEAENDFKTFGGRLGSLAATAGVATAVAFGVALVGAMSEQEVGAKIAAQLGQSADHAEKYGHLAGKIYAENFGESVADVGDALAKIMRAGAGLNLSGDTAEIEKLTKHALTLRDVFGQDLTRAVAAVEQIMRNGLAKNATEAFDLLTRGIQTGADKSEDLADTFVEYSTQFREMGLSGAEALGLMNQMLAAGARNSDIAADAIKEFAIRSKDGSKLSREGFAAIGLNADRMFRIFNTGGPAAKTALQDVVNRLKAMKDPVAQDAAAVALFGTKAEDLQDALYAINVDTAASSIGNLAGATQRAADTMGSTAASNVKSFGRQLEVTFTQVLGGVVLPAVTKVAKFMATEFGPAFKTAAEWIKRNQEWLGPLAVALGTLAVIIGVIVAAVKIWTIVSAAYTAVQMALNTALIANPIGLIVIAIAALAAGLIYAYKHSETFRKIVDGAFKGVAVVAMWLWNNVLKPVFGFLVWQFKTTAAIVLWLWNSVLKPVFSFIGRAFGVWMQNVRSAGALFVWLGKTILGPIIEFVLAYLRMWGAAFGWLWANAIKPAIDGIAAAIGWVWNTILQPVFTKVMAIVDKVGETFKSVFSKISGFVTSAFDKAVDIAKGAINGLIGLLNKAIGFINNNLVDSLNKVPGVDFSRIPTLPKLAQGGKVQPVAGGRPVIMGDGGQVEYGVPHDDMERIIDAAVTAGGRGGDGATIQIIVMDELRRVRKTTRVQGGRPSTVLVGG